MVLIKHKFRHELIAPVTETLIIGTFNPDFDGNNAEFFYGRSRKLPLADSLRG